MENLLDLIYEHYTENNPVEKNTVAGKAAKEKEKELEEWLRGLEGMDRLVDDYVGDKIPLWEKIMDRQGTVCCAWEKTAFECEATLCHPHRRRFEISRNSDGGDALAATRRSNARRDDAVSLPCLMPGILPDMRQGHDVKP